MKMKSTALAISMIGSTWISTLALAQNPMLNQDMQAMMTKMQGMQDCIAKIDQKALMAVSQEAQQIQKEISALCQQGKSSEAEQRAMGFVKTLQNSKEVPQLQACLKDLPDMMKGHTPFPDMGSLQQELQQEDICSLSGN